MIVSFIQIPRIYYPIILKYRHLFDPMMKNVQKEKVVETVELLCKFYHDKEEFMKLHIPVQEYLIKRIEETADLTLKTLEKLAEALKEEKNLAASQYQIKEKGILSKREEFKLMQKKNPGDAFTEQEWNRNILRVLQSMSEVHCAKVHEMKRYYKSIESAYNEVIKEEQRYRGEVKTIFKQLNNLFNQIDENEKQQNKVLHRITKDSKAKDMKTSVYFLSEVKKAQAYLAKEIQFFVQRGSKVLTFVKLVVKNEIQVSKNMKVILTTLSTKNKEIFKNTPTSDKFDGLLAVLEDGVQDSRELYMEKTLVSADIQQKMKKLAPIQKSKVHHMMKYLGLSAEEIEHKMGAKTRMDLLAKNLAFKNFSGVSLASGWIVTSYTPAVAYLTYDHHLALYDMGGTLLRKIHSSSAVINKVVEPNTVFLEETVKGFFTDSKEEYQVKFDDSDRMEQFILFIENQIS